MYSKKLILFFSLLLLFIISVQTADSLSVGSCTPSHCPYGYHESQPICNNGTCKVSCTFFSGCSTNFSTVYNDSEYLPNLNIASYSGSWYKSFQIGNYTPPSNSTKCYKFRHSTPNEFISSSAVYRDSYTYLSDYDAGTSLYWTDFDKRSMWFNNQKNFSLGEKNDYIAAYDVGGVWADSCSDDGDDFASADSYRYQNNMSCAPTLTACNNLSSNCDTECYGVPTELDLVLTTWVKNGLACNRFSDFDNSASAFYYGYINYVNFASQTVNMYIDASDAIANETYNNSCNYWPQCDPSEPCCNQDGYFRQSGYVCKNAHNAVCDSSTTCSGRAYENRCSGTSSSCPSTEYGINYSKACDDLTCSGQSCSGSTLSPSRTCSSGICQRNDPYYCPNNLNCQDSISCKNQASSINDCRSNYSYNSNNNVCLVNDGKIVLGIRYDSNGNLVNGPNLNYSYNSLNQLVNVSRDNILIAQYYYDENGNRIKTVEYGGNNSNITTYYFGNFVQIVNSSGTYNETYYYYNGGVIGKNDSAGKTLYYHSDILGSTSLITDNNSNQASYLTYEPFGKLSSSSNEKFTYTGHEQDTESSLIYMKARYYDPEIGRFLKPDALVQDIYNPQDLNRYTYARNNPYRYTDPSGNFADIILDVGFILYDIYEIFNDPSSISNYGDLGLDIVGAFVPFATGFGGASKLFKSFDKASDVARGVDKASDVARGVDKASDVARGADKAKDASKTFNPKDIRYTQKEMSSYFKDTKKPVSETIEELKSGATKVSDIPTINVVENGGKYYSLDNRRLFAFKEAGVKEIPVNVRDLSDPKILEEFLRKFDTKNGGTSIRVR